MLIIRNFEILIFFVFFFILLFGKETKKLTVERNSNICIFDKVEFIKNNKCQEFNLNLIKDSTDEINKNKNIINIYWWNRVPNAGDYFGKWLLEKMGYKVKFSYKPELIVCGSVLGFGEFKNTKIWGAGYHYEEEKQLEVENRIFYAVRGKLTYNKLNLSSNIALGDSGLLLSRFFQPKTQKEHEVCIVSHYIDYQWFKKNYTNKYYVINMGINNIEKIANEINKCYFVFSSSLHGIVFSHSLGVPAIHIEKIKLGSKNNFKFKDYYSVLDIPYIKEDLNEKELDEFVGQYIKNKSQYLPKKKIIKQIQDNLLFTFPYQKMGNVIYSVARKENIYINDWCHHHINLGFDNIYIYDNNENRIDYINHYIDDNIRNKVHILNIYDKQLKQNNAYKTFYDLFNHNFKWCAYIDIDEFIILEKYNNISQFLNNKLFQDTIYIIFHSNIFENNNSIEKQFKLFTYKEITKRLMVYAYVEQDKSIIKNDSNRVIFKTIYPNVSSNLITLKFLLEYINEIKIIINTKNIKFGNNNYYITKIISEFDRQKLNNAKNKCIHLTLNYFYGINSGVMKQMKRRIDKIKNAINKFNKNSKN